MTSLEALAAAEYWLNKAEEHYHNGNGDSKETLALAQLSRANTDLARALANVIR